MKQTGLQVVLGALVGVVCGCASALFLTMLEWVTSTRVADERWVWALPLGGFVIGLVYERFGARVRAGNNLIIDTIHDGGPEVPLRMAPMVLLGTVAAHLFGASVGREGTAVQMGASLADFLSHRLKLNAALRTQLLSAGVAGGFGSVFGTPIAGAIFGLEFVRKGHVKYGALLPALVAAVVGDLTTRALGVGHTHYKSAPVTPLTWALALKWLPFALAIALTTIAFVEVTHLVKKYAEKWVPRLPVRMALGGVVLIVLWLGFGGEFLGLGVPTIVRAFEDPALPLYVFAVKLVFTALSIGAGFPGGEVTPLFFIGATLGSVLARLLGIPIELGAGVGLAAVFASASNTPIALSVMAVELLGASVFPHVAIVAIVAHVLTGDRSIYPSQLRHITSSVKPGSASNT